MRGLSVWAGLLFWRARGNTKGADRRGGRAFLVLDSYFLILTSFYLPPWKFNTTCDWVSMGEPLSIAGL